MDYSSRTGLLQIKKYPNRRYYDATRSRHVTLQEVHDLVRDGSDVLITDSRTGADITNLVLFQIIMEKDQPKLDLFPSAFAHMVLRRDRQALRATFDRFFGPFTALLSGSQQQMDAFWHQTLKRPLGTPLDWASAMLQSFAPNRASGSRQDDEPGEPVKPDESLSEQASDDGALDELRRQVADLTERIEQFTSSPRKQGS